MEKHGRRDCYLLEAKRMLPQFFNNSDIGLAIFDDRFRYRVVNPYLAASHGAPLETHLGKHVREILDDVGIQAEAAIRRVLETGRPVLHQQVAGAFKTKPQGGRWLGTLFPILESDGKVAKVGVVVVELSPRLLAEQPPPLITPPSGILRSWKEISHYVGSCVKTVQRWEQAHDFPVHRVSQNKGAVVFAFKDEIDCWLRTQLVPGEAGRDTFAQRDPRGH